MAAASAKLVFFLGGLKWGWTEDWLWTIGDGTIDDAISDALGYVINRRACLATNWSVEAARIEMTDQTGASFILGASKIQYREVQAGPGKAKGDCSNPWLSGYARFYSAGAAYARNMLWRGFPDTWNCIGPGYQVPPTLANEQRQGLQPLLDYITSAFPVAAKAGGVPARRGNFCLRASDKPNGKGKAVKITGVVADVSGNWKITTDNPIKVTVAPAAERSAGMGDVIHVHNLKGTWATRINGQARVVGFTAPSTYVIDRTPQNGCVANYTTGGTAWGVSHILVPVVEGGQPNRITSRPTGQRFFGTRGRRRKAA
jgi:hypothetical protein